MRPLLVIVAKETAEAVVAGDVSFGPANFFTWHDEVVAESLVIAFGVIMGVELGNSASKRLLSEEYHSLEALGFHGAHVTLDVRVQIRAFGAARPRASCPSLQARREREETCRPCRSTHSGHRAGIRRSNRSGSVLLAAPRRRSGGA